MSITTKELLPKKSKRDEKSFGTIKLQKKEIVESI